MLFQEDHLNPTRKTLSLSMLILKRLHLDGVLVALLLTVIVFGLFVLYSATGENVGQWFGQIKSIILAFLAFIILAQIPPRWIRLVTPFIYATGIILLVVVAVHGSVGKGAQRWLDLKVFRFQPSEIMKLAVPMMCAWYVHERPLPPSFKDV